MSITFNMNPFKTVLFLVTNLIGFLIIQSWIVAAREQGSLVTSPKELTQLADLMDSYVQYFGHFPPVGKSLDQALREGEGELPLTYKDPLTGDQLPISFNNKLRGLKLKDLRRPEQTVVFYMPSFGRDTPGLLASFADGKVRHIAFERLGLLVWDPKAP